MSVYPVDESLVSKSAVLSEFGGWRYRLLRVWDKDKPLLPFVMLNPSIADGQKDDPTIRMCVANAVALDYGGIGVWNLYAYIATKPAALWEAQQEGNDIVGPENDRRLRNLLAWAALGHSRVVAAWGVNAKPDRVAEVMSMPGATDVLHSFGVTAKGHPRHPLMLKHGTPLEPWRIRQ